MSNRPDLDEAIDILLAGGWNITGGIYAPKDKEIDNDKEVKQEILYEFLNQFKEDKYLSQSNTDKAVEAIDQYTQSKLKAFADELEKASIHYTDDGLKADGLDPWAVPVVTLKAIKERAGIE